MCASFLVLLALGAAESVAADASPTSATVSVTVGRESVFDVGAPNGVATAAERAKAAQSILNQVVQDPTAPALVAIDTLPAGPDDPGANLAVRVDGREVFRIGPADVARSGLAADVYSQSLRASLQAALQRERRHVQQQRLLESISLVVFLGLLLFLSLRGVRQAMLRARASVEAQLTKMHGIRLRDFELLSPEALEGVSYVLVGMGRVLLQLGLIYLYLIFVLTRFVSTRGWVTPLNRALAEPFARLGTRIVELFPVSLLALLALLVVLGALRLASFFLARVASGEFQWSWLPKDLAPALTPLLRAAIVVAALLLFGPLIGSDQNELLTRIGLLLLSGAGLALVPLLATAMVGVVTIIGRRYQVGEWLVIGPLIGEVTEVGYLGLTLVPAEAGRVWIPHLVFLWTSVRHLPAPPPTELELPVDPKLDPNQVIELLSTVTVGNKKVETRLLRLTNESAVYGLRLPPHADASALLAAAWTAMAAVYSPSSRERSPEKSGEQSAEKAAEKIPETRADPAPSK